MSWYECGNCQYITTDESVLLPITDFWQRVAPGEVCPAGECPECGALVHIVDEK